MTQINRFLVSDNTAAAAHRQFPLLHSFHFDGLWS